MRRSCLASLLILLLAASSRGNVDDLSDLHHDSGRMEFVQNDGQWEDPSLFQVRTHGARIYFEQNRITFLTFDRSEFDALHLNGCPDVEVQSRQNSINEIDENRDDYFSCLDDVMIYGHVYRVYFSGANENYTIQGQNPKPNFHNYYLGNDASKWKERVPLYREVQYSDLYNNIDLVYYSEDVNLKYDFIVRPGGEVSDIQLVYEDLDRLELKNNKVYLHTSLGEVVEWEPYAYQLVNGERQQIKVNYTLDDNVVGFEAIDSYNKNETLYIDPAVVLSTYSGSTADNWGYTATYDRFGNLYGAGFAEGSGYPVTGGAFDMSYGGGTSGTWVNGGFIYTLVPTDIVITKFNPDGSQNLYSTYLGGNRNELPHSLIVDNNDQLVLLGTTASTDFPTTPGCFDNTFNGGSQINIINSIRYQDGSDIIISKFAIDGGSLIASTFLGGSDNDGLNATGQTRLEFNYGDAVRGDIIIDDANNIYITTCTFSTDFPGTAGHAQPSNGGYLDGVVSKLSGNLTSLIWSTYLGGSSHDAAYSVKLDAANNLVIGGGTRSSDLPGMNGLITSYRGGDADGFVARLSNDGNTITSGTYLGTGQYDQVFMIEIDEDNNVYALGQNLAEYPVVNAGYSRPKAPQFIHKLSPDLATTIFSTTFGRENYTNDQLFGFQGYVNISPTSFLVDICGNIYATGWGGAVNNSWNDNGGTVAGMGVSADAEQPPYFRAGTSGDDFYIFVLDQDANNLVFGAYFGEPGGSGIGQDHVDGGSCRFDENGVIYHAVCASCSGTDGWPTTPTAYSSTNNSPNCNMAAYKLEFDLSPINSAFDLSADSGCAPLTIDFTNLTNKPFAPGQTIFWDFGDGNTLTNVEDPVYTYTVPGTYTVQLIVTDPAECNFSDTSYATIVVDPGGATSLFTMDVSDICNSGDVVFTNNSIDGTGYEWNYGDGNTSTTSAGTHTHTYAGTGPYTVSLVAYDGSACAYNDTSIQIINAPCCPIIISVTTSPENCTSADGSVAIDVGTTGLAPYDFSTNGGVSYILNDVAGNQVLSGLANGTYTITVRDDNNCAVDTVVTIAQNNSYVLGTANSSLCPGEFYTMPLGEVITSAGIYTDTIPGFNCDSIVTVTVNIDALTNGSESIPLCSGQSYTMPLGEIISVPGTYTDTIPGFNCDSIVTVFISMSSNSSGSATVDLCSGESYIMPLGEVISVAGIYVDTLTGFSCDSVVTVTINMSPFALGSASVQLCDGQSYTMPLGENISTAGTYTDTIPGFNCDSIVTVLIGVSSNSSGSEQVDLCSGESYTMPLGEIISVAGTYIDTLSGFSCDSIVTVTISTFADGSITLTPSICNGSAYTMPLGEVITVAGTYQDTLTGFRCDSIVTVILSINSFSTGTSSVGICDGDSYVLPGGEIVNTAGMYTDTIAGHSCDSIITVTVNIIPDATSSVEASLCPGDSYVMPLGEVVTQAGTYTDTIPGSRCDSVITVTVAALSTSFNTITETICPGDSSTIDGNTYYTSTGTYMATLSGFLCDSIVTLNLTVDSPPSTAPSLSICAGDSASINGSDFYNTSGSYTDTLSGVGCDSIITLNLTVLPNPSNSITVSLCEGDSATTDGIHYYYATGIYSDTIAGWVCDSVITLDLTVNPNSLASIVRGVCFGDSVTINGIDYYYTTGIYNETLNGFMCDSIVTLDLTVSVNSFTPISETICTGDSATINGFEYFYQSGVFLDTLVGIGCDSVVSLDLTVHPIPETTIVSSICTGESATINGVDNYTTSGTYTETLNGWLCDSIVTLVLTVTDFDLLSVDVINSNCHGDDGNVTFATSGGIDPITYEITASDGSLITTTSTSTDLPPGDYSVDIADAIQCQLNAAFSIGTDASPAVVVTPSQVSIFEGESVELTALPSNGSFNWSPIDFLSCDTCSNVTATPAHSISYIVYYDVNGCLASDTVTIEVRQPDAFIPSAFSPNGDGHNDLLFVFDNFIEVMQFFRIYNRWGELVFETDNIQIGWDGKYENNEQEMDIYLYHIRAQLKSGRLVNLKGPVMLLK